MISVRSPINCARLTHGHPHVTCLHWNSSVAQRRGAFAIVRSSPQVPDKPVKSEAEEATEKYGLEAGLFKTLTGKAEGGMSRTQQAKALLTQYGSAYLITSISFAAVSFAICYAAVSGGLDVAALLAKIGLHVSGNSERVSTVAIAYAAHKALSPVRFPPTVALTPVVARWLGRSVVTEAGSGSSSLPEGTESRGSKE